MGKLLGSVNEKSLVWTVAHCSEFVGKGSYNMFIMFVWLFTLGMCSAGQTASGEIHWNLT